MPLLDVGSSETVSYEDTGPEYNLYFGDLHSHTSYSDGEGTPDEAFDMARSSGADFLAITDHGYLLLDREWADTLVSADEHTSSDFVAMAGYEYFIPGINEINIYGTSNMPPGSDERATEYCESGRMIDASVVRWTYDWIASEPGAVGQWNHPLAYGCPYCFDWYNYSYITDERDAGMGMVEAYNSYDRSASYILALDQGWHVMPTATTDTHLADWIAGSEIRTVLLAPSLTRDDLYDAMRCGRGYGTLDSDLRISFSVNGAVMGSVLPSSGTIFEVCVSIEDPSGLAADAITRAEVVSDGGEVVASMGGDGGTTLDWEVSLESVDSSYYFLRVYTESGDGGLPGITAWTAPVWTGN
ncbi:MAG: CehA/McbA family metallohydrolase [Thermoplasmata archaeon]|nr:CehA/McbA family metallohydrolase [Thermoplasmata archaeon]